MRFAFTEEQALIDETAKRFFAENATSARTRAAMATREGYDRELWQAFTSELGLAGVALPEAHGGGGLGFVELAILAEAAGAHLAAIPFLGSLCLVAQAILAGGSDAQRAHWLPVLASGGKIGALGTGNVHADRDGRVSGVIELLAHGAAADLFVVGCGQAAWLVRRDAESVAVEPLVTMDQTRPFARLVLDRVPAEPLPESAAALDAADLCGWVELAAEALGGAQACLDRTVAYSLDRVQFGRPIGSFQAVKHRLADMMVEIEQARSAVYWAACAADEGSADARLAAHAAKAFAADAFSLCAGEMIQLHGGIGFTWEHDAHLFFKRARGVSSLLGSSDWHRERIARAVGLDADVGEPVR